MSGCIQYLVLFHSLSENPHQYRRRRVQKLRKIEDQSAWTQVRKLCALIEGALYFLREGWLADFIFMGIMISIFFFCHFFVFVSWIAIKDDKIFPCSCEQFFLYLNITCEWRIEWIKCDWQTILFKIDKFLGYLKEPNL